jgi:ribosomal protein S7
VISKFEQRSELGIKKYGTTLEENNTDDFINHLQEELMDAILYLEKIKSIKRREQFYGC